MARKKKGEGSQLPITERFAPDGRLMGYQVRIRRVGFPTITKQFDKKADAERWAINTLSAMDQRTFVDRRTAERTTLTRALDDYEQQVTVKKRGAAQEQGRIKRLKERRLADYSLVNITRREIADFVAEREREGVSANSIRLELALISHLYSTARKRWGMNVNNPVKDVQKPAPGQARTRRLEPIGDGMSEEAFLRMGAEESKARAWLVPLIRLALATAMRKGEMLTCTWSQVDKQARVIHLTMTKNGDTRDVPLSPDALAVLDGMEQGKPNDKIFPSGASGTLTPCFRRACERGGIEGLNFHDLRHEAISRLFEQGFDIMQAASVSGHKTLAMLRRYTHLRASDLADKMAKIHAAQ